MTPIIAIIKPGDAGAPVANLQDALAFLAAPERKIIQALDPPNHPTPQELKILTTGLRQEREKSQFGDSTRQLVRYFQVQQHLGDNLNGEVEETSAAKLNELLKSFGALDQVNLLRVHGTVITFDNKPIQGASVKAFDQDLRKEQPLGDEKTDSLGQYVISYGPEKFRAGDVPSASVPKLIVRAYDSEGQQIGNDVIPAKPSRDQEVNFKAPAPVISEWETFSAGVKPLLVGQGKGDQDLPEEEITPSDLDFIAEETGLDRAKLRFWALAFSVRRSAAGGGIAPEVFYGWFRLRLPTDPASLWSMKTADLMAKLQTAIDSNIAPRQLAALLNEISATIDKVRVDSALKPAGDRQPGSLGDLLATMTQRLSLEQEQIVAAAVQSALNPDDLAKRLTEAQFDPKQIAGVQVTHALGELTLNHTGLVRDLQAMRKDTADSSLRFLTSITPLQWLTLAQAHQTDSSVAPSPENYAARLEQAVEEQFPTAVLTARIQTGQLELQDTTLKQAAAFLASNPTLELKDGNARTFVNSIEKVDEKEVLVQGLQRMQRVRNLVQNWREAGALFNGGFASGRDVVLHGKDAFVESVQATIPPRRAAAIYVEAKRVHDTTVALVANAYAGVSSRKLGVFDSDSADADLPDANDYPNIRQLFGNLTTCACDECQSVLSPAAYLVDLLRFLDPQTEQSRTAPPPLSILLGRRPDIADLELTCENTKTEIPYIDLVLEVLENAVGLPIEIPAPYGFNPQTDLMQDAAPTAVLDALRKVLEQSAIAVGDHLQIQRFNRQLLIGTFIDRLISDGTRHWVLRYFPKALTSSRSNFIPRQLNVVDYAGAIAALDAGRLPDAAWVLPPNGSQNDKNLPLMANPIVTQLQAGMKWSVKYTRAARVRVTVDAAARRAAVIIESADGRNVLDMSQYAAEMVQLLAAALNQGRLIQPLISLLPGGLQYQITKAGSDWQIATSGEITVDYVTERLEIASLTYQTSDARADLLATPENRNPAAYDKLDGAVYPWTLPFNLWLEEVRVFLDRRGVPRRRLMEQCDPAARLTSPSIGREVLGLSLSEWNIITSADQHQQWEYWGLQETGNRIVDRNDGRTVATGSWLDVLGWNLSILLQQSGLNYRELLNVLQTRFVLAEAPALAPVGDSCNPSGMKLPGLRPEHLDRIHRLVRVWRKLGWSIFDIDLAIAATTADPTSLKDTTLLGLAGLRRLRELLGIAVSEIAAWWGPLTQGYYDYTSASRPVIQSLYERLFLNPTTVNPPERAFKLNDQKNEVDYEDPQNKPTLADKAASIIAALGISQSDFDALTADLLARQELAASAVLSLGNLSILFRNVSVAKSLRLSMDSYLRLRTLLAVDLFAAPAKAIEFVEKVRFVSKSGFSVDALDYLLAYKFGDEPNPLMPLDWAAGVLGDLRGALQGVQKDVLGSADSPDANLRKLLGGIGWYDTLVEAAVNLLASSGQLEVRIGGNPNVTIPAALAALVAYRVGDGTLSASPTVTPVQWDAFRAANAAPVQTSIDALRGKVTAFAVALPDLSHQMQSFELPVFSVSYDPQTPPGIPRDLSARCYFDAALKRLVFVGWMTDSQRTEISASLPATDVAVVNQLKTWSDQYSEASPLNRFLFDLGQVQALFAIDQTADTRVKAVLGTLLPYMYRKTVVERVSQAVDLDPEVMDALLSTKLAPSGTFDSLLTPPFLDSDTRVTVTPSAFPVQFRALCRVQKAAFVCRALKVQPAEIQWLPPGLSQPTFDVLNLDELPVSTRPESSSYEMWQRLVQLFALRDRPQVGQGMIARLQSALTVDPASLTTIQPDVAGQFVYLAQVLDSPAEDVSSAATALSLQWPADYHSVAKVSTLIQWLFYTRIGRAVQLSPQDVAKTCVRLNAVWPADFRDPATLTELLELLITLQRLGANADDAFSLVEDAAATANLAAKPGKSEAVLARKLLRARYDESAWPQQLRTIVNVLRQKQRDALVAYLLARPPENAVNGGMWTDASDLYEHFLIDPEMSSCRVSTRILHAISAVQLFIQRCVMNLETGVSPAAIDPERLKWMSQYRVWQANREVFLYPENWIEPELRRDKSELFADLQGQLQQNEFDNDRAEDILKDFLKELEDISHLLVVGMYVEKTSDATGRAETRVHTVGRTSNRPSHFFYRRWILSDLVNRWEPWEHLPLEGVKSDHILPFVMRGDVYIAWPEITQVAAQPGAGDAQAPGASWRVQMAWIRRTNRGWNDRLMSGDVFEHPWVYNKDENQTFTFRVRKQPDESTNIDCYGAVRDGPLLYDKNNLDLADIAPFRTPPPAMDSNAILAVLIPPTAPWIGVKVNGIVYGSYANDVYLPLAGVTVKVTTIFHGTPDNSQANTDLDSDKSTEFKNYQNTDIDSATTGADGTFNLTLALVAQIHGGSFDHASGYFENSVLEAKPTFELEASFGSLPTQTKSFPYADSNVNATYQYYSDERFQQNFMFSVGGVAPGGNADRAVPMEGIRTLHILTADDVEIKFETDPLDLPAGILTYGSGFKISAAQNDELTLDSISANAVWRGVAQTYWLLPSAQSDNGAPDVFVYRDAKDSYYIRRESPAIDSPTSEGKFQILVDGHPRASDLRLGVAIYGAPSAFDLSQETWTDPAVAGAGATFDNHSPEAPVDIVGSLTGPAIFFEPDGAKSPYASYNTELFFHGPFLMGTFLSRNQRFPDAQQWFHYIFNPTSDEPGTGNQRYWRYLPFRIHSITTPVDELLMVLADPRIPASDAAKKQITTQIETWAKNPFDPHAIAWSRPRAYEFSIVFKYLDNLVAWGDSLFRQYSTESINAATQLYVLAAKLLGPRPQSIPRATQPAPQTYRSLNNQWDLFSNAWMELEANLSLPGSTASDSLPVTKLGRKDTTSLSSLGMLYFCVPGNDKMLDYWDTIEQRLFNIRHCRNIDGVEQDVPLFQPPIDPALLVRAMAAGVDISTVLSDINTPLPHYRFGTMAQKASELSSEVKALGSALLSALEKKDAEDLALLRSSQELGMLSLMQTIKEKQIEEANANIDALTQNEQVAIARFVQYQRSLGKNDAQVPDDFGADVEQSSSVTISKAAVSGDVSNLGLTQSEQDQFDWSEVAMRYGTVAGIHNIVSGILFAFPSAQVGTPFVSSHYGGPNLGQIMNAGAAFWSTLERNATHQATRSAAVGQFQRRQDEWVFQSRLALRDVLQIRRQIIAAQVRLDIAKQELINHQQQMKNAADTDQFMREKYTNRELYQWMTQQISAVYFGAYQLAYAVAKRAEQAFRFELGLNDSKYIQYGYWDSLKKGLLAGERLSQDVKRLEVAYLDQNQREYEITKHISMLALDPTALITLRETGTCELSVPEVLFDLDYPGHYFRRIKSVGVTLPCVTGPYTGVSCTLTLLKTSIRQDSSAENGYHVDLEQDTDPRFRENFGAIQSIVTSSAQQDSGLFETNLRDERYLPFEGLGAISTWRMEMPTVFRPFDYDTLADVILHVRYTARDGGVTLKTACQGELSGSLNVIKRLGNDAGLTRMFSLRQEFPSQWSRLTSEADGASSQEFGLDKSRFPLLFSARDTTLTISSVDLYMLPTQEVGPQEVLPAFPKVFLPKQSPQSNLVEAQLTNLSSVGRMVAKHLVPKQTDGSLVIVSEKDEGAGWRLEVAQSEVALFRQDVRDIVLVCHYSVG